MGETLRDRLLGVWELLEVVERPVDGSAVRLPLGERPIGLLVYTADGYMSVQLMRRGRSVPASADTADFTLEESAEMAGRYVAYAGRYDVDEGEATVTHTPAVALFPGWVGRPQLRAVQLDGDDLTLSTAGSWVSGGTPVTTRLRWRRAGVRGSGGAGRAPA